MPLLLMLWCNVVKRNWTIILMQTVLYVLFSHKSFYNKAISLLLYSLLFFITIHAVWFGHKRAFRAGGFSRKEFFRQMYYKLFTCLKFLHSSQQKESILEVSSLNNRL